MSWNLSPIRPNAILACALIALIVCPVSFTSALAQTGDPREIDAVLTRAEDIFKAMKARNCPAVWSLLSARSKDSIVNDTHKRMAEGGAGYSRDQVRSDFQAGGLISKSYWTNYLAAFDPDVPLEQSKWEMDFVKAETAQVRIQYKKSDKPVYLQMYKEQGAWKVGLEETFGARKWLLK